MQAVVAIIKDGKEVVIVPDKPLKSEGKEWMKLLGVQWWAQLAGDHRYIVPAAANCAAVRESLQVLNHKGITDVALQIEYEKISGTDAMVEAFKEEGREEGREEGEQIGQLKSLMQGFIAGQFFDFLANGLDSQFLSGDFVRTIWNTLPPSANKTEEKLEDFLQALQERELI
ncbi:MAG: hypothetical protein LBD60_00745 [Puniceicoccales bacterium]|nr:hypothetical protein [Puniceicoccales bacterium]